MPLIQFTGVPEGDPIGDYYNGGAGGSLGVSFSVNGVSPAGAPDARTLFGSSSGATALDPAPSASGFGYAIDGLTTPVYITCAENIASVSFWAAGFGGDQTLTWSYVGAVGNDNLLLLNNQWQEFILPAPVGATNQISLQTAGGFALDDVNIEFVAAAPSNVIVHSFDFASRRVGTVDQVEPSPEV